MSKTENKKPLPEQEVQLNISDADLVRKHYNNVFFQRVSDIAALLKTDKHYPQAKLKVLAAEAGEAHTICNGIDLLFLRFAQQQAMAQEAKAAAEVEAETERAKSGIVTANKVPGPEGLTVV